MTGIRARVRAELTAEIKAIARRQMAVDGTSALSLRAVARELGMASSAIYRYFPGRDELLTALIVDAYNEIGAAAEAADATVAPDDVLERWRAVAGAAYAWAVAHPAEYGLLFGTPVPGYAAPVDTIAPAGRFTAVLLTILAEGHRQGIRPLAAPVVPDAVRADLDRVRAVVGAEIDDEVVIAGMLAWMGLFGAISFILFGQLQNVIDDRDAFFGSVADTLGRQLFP